MRETWDNSEPKRQNLKTRTRGSTSLRLLVDLFTFCRQFTSEDPALTLLSSVVQARLTQRPTFRLSLKPSLNRLFPYSSGTGPSSPCEASALQARSTRSLQPCSRRMKSALPSLKRAVAVVFGQMSDPRSVPALLKVLKTREKKKWCTTKRRRLLVELPRTRSCRCCEARDDAPRMVRESCRVAIDMWDVCCSSDF